MKSAALRRTVASVASVATRRRQLASFTFTLENFRAPELPSGLASFTFTPENFRAPELPSGLRVLDVVQRQNDDGHIKVAIGREVVACAHRQLHGL